MPTYTFQCPKCQHKFTDMFLMKDSGGKNVVCPKCKNKGVKRVYEGSFSIGTKSKAAKIEKSTCPTCSNGTCQL